MNAFTSTDYTCYPFATTNRKDFNNLMSVYLDATLHPLLKENDFTQEGWRIGPQDPEALSTGQSNKEAGRLVFKGVVYNEMKGQMSDASYLYYIRYQDHIFPDINNSGGDPQKMTDLTYEDLKNFHAKNYHPSNARIFTYGDMPLSDHLTEVNRQLEVFERIQADKAVKEPIKIDSPQNIVVKGPIDPLVDQAMQYKTSTSWIMGQSSDILETFSLGVMSSLLIDGYGSPLYRELVESGLGPNFSPMTGYDSSSRTGIFCIGLDGVKEENVAKVKEVIHKTLQDVRQKGFDQHKIDGFLHQLELALKHKTARFGMGLMNRLQPGWFNGVDPFDSLQWNKTVAAFKEKLQQGGYLEGLLDRYLLNDKTLTFTMEPSTTYGEDLVKEETERLASKIAEVEKKLGGEKAAQQAFTTQELELVEVQNSARTMDINCLPTVRVSDIPREMEKKLIRDSKTNQVNVQWREANTNGLTYFRAINTLDGLPKELRSLIPLFSSAIMRIGTKDKSMEEIEDLIKLKTGGIDTDFYSSSNPNDSSIAKEGIALSGYALDQNIPEMYNLLRLIIQETNFDKLESSAMIQELLQSDASGALGSVAHAGSAYARRYAESGLTPNGALVEQADGLTRIRNVTLLASRSSEQGFRDVVEKLKQIQTFAISNSANFRAAITCSPESVSSNEKALHKFLSDIKHTPLTLGQFSQPTTPVRTGKTFFHLPYQVYYSATSLRSVPYTSISSAPLSILAQLLTHRHLHHEIREKGGAYGGGAYASPLNGTFGFHSYRDPNPQNTMKIVADAGRWARDKQWTEQELEEAKLSVFQGLDAPQSVNQEGMTRFLSGISEDMEQTRREQLLDVRIEDVRKVADEIIIRGMPNAVSTVLGEKKSWIDDEWSVVDINV